MHDETKAKAGECKCGGDKCGQDAPVDSYYYDPFAQITTWDEVDALANLEAERGQLSLAQSLVTNIMNNDDLTFDDKQRLINDVFKQLPSRVSDVQVTMKASFLDKVKGVVGLTNKVEWSTSYINNLPDNAFAYIETGGEKDSDGKTAPRSKRHFPHHNENGHLDLPHLRNALARAPQSEYGPKAKAHLDAHARDEEIGQYAKETAKEAQGSLNVFKDATGQWRWIGAVSNKFEDRDKEILTEAAHVEFVEHVTKTGAYPELWVWHAPGTRVGVADAVAYIGGFRVDTGTFDEGMEDVAESLSKDKDLGMSHGFNWVEGDFDGKTYRRYRTFEDSVLPLHKAANIYTAFTIEQVKEAAMSLTAEQRSFLVDKLGEERVTTLETTLPAFTKQLEDQGVSWKDIAPIVDLNAALGEAPGPDPKPDEGEGDEGEGDGDAGAAPSDVTLETIGARVDQVVGAVETLVGAMKTQRDAIAALQKTDDEKIKAMVEPRRPAPVSNDRPSENDDNVIAEDIVEKLFGKDDKGDDAPNTNPARPYVEDMLGVLPGTRR